MKKLTLFLLSLLTLTVTATNYYVAVNGNDNNSGTLNKPWATWEKAFTSTLVNAGDTVFIRGGVYNMTVKNGNGYGVTRAGSKDNWIVYTNYPSEVPILDCSDAFSTSGYNSGIGASTTSGANYIKFKGLTVRNVKQKTDKLMIYCSGIGFENGNFIAENCVAYNIEGIGFESYFYNGYPDVNGNHYFINCDSYNNWNPTNPPGYLPGNKGTGFSSQNWYGTEGKAYAINCRAWNNGDQGFSWNGEHYCEATGCWSFNNGVLQGDGHGFKLGWHNRRYNGANVVIKNCIAAFNRASGMTTNDRDEGIATGMNIYNNTIYHNGYKGGIWNYTYGLYVYNTPDNISNEMLREFRNNISYKNQEGDIYLQNNPIYSHSNNTWDIPIKVTDSDFLSLDSTGLSSPRTNDGKLPELNFLRPSKDSKLIDKGINVGMPFSGKSPDLGVFEYSPVITPVPIPDPEPVNPCADGSRTWIVTETIKVVREVKGNNKTEVHIKYSNCPVKTESRSVTISIKR